MDIEVKPSHYEPSSKYRLLPISLVDPNPKQPRRVFDDGDLKDLTSSILNHGVLQPILVRQAPSGGRWELVAGERRLRASKKAGLTSIPALIEKTHDKDLLALALIENIQRADLNPIEEAEAIDALIREHRLTQEECAERVGKDRTTVANLLRLLNLPDSVKADIECSKLTVAHGKAFLQLNKEELILQVHKTVVAKGLNVKQTNKLCKAFLRPGATASEPRVDHNIDYIAETLRTILQTKVRVTGNASKGRIEVSYFSPSELERILEILKPQNSLI
ncbi:MAG: ParB/RepB/Spo0J family partition protein [Oligoflexales bacterium]